MNPAQPSETSTRPLDFPVPERPHRVYLALTNRCNRHCPWCSTCSSLEGQCFMSEEVFESSLPTEGPFEAQLEGGEPTVHPYFDGMVRRLREHPRCRRLVVGTNGVILPRHPKDLAPWLDRLGPRSTVKLSINHHLLEKDPGLLDLAVALHREIEARNETRLFVANVRLRKGVAQDDRAVREAVTRAGLDKVANVFFLQRCGRAEDQTAWERPFLVGTNFRMILPDGTDCGTDMLARADAMRRLP